MLHSHCVRTFLVSKRCLPVPPGLTFRLGYRQLPRSFFVDQPEAAERLVQTVRRVASFGRVPRSRGAPTKGVTYGHLTDNDLASGLLSGV